MRVGLGTGSTVHFTIVALGEQRPDILCTATSVQTDEMYGMIIIARMIPAESIPTATLGPWKNGSQPK